MFLETSAKTAFNVIEAFNLSAKSILQNMEKNGITANKDKRVKITNESNQTKDKKKCC